MDDNFNKLTPAETERLALLAEECGEVVQIIGKTLRHGYESTNPVTGDGVTNRTKLELELGDIMAALRLMDMREDVELDRVLDNSEIKFLKVNKWLHHNNTFVGDNNG